MVISCAVLVILLLNTSGSSKRAFNAQVQQLATSNRASQENPNSQTKISNSRGAGNSRDARHTTIKVGDVKFEERVSAKSRVVLAKKIRFARWKMAPSVFRLFELGLSIIAFLILSLFLSPIFLPISFVVGPLIMRSLLKKSVETRFLAFDKDYAPFLLSVVGLLKTGMTPLVAIGAAAEGLEPESLLRLEVEVMIERTRYGVAEEASIGSFGEDINHPEIELFVQALLLSRSVGGVLSDTLERLARQTRRRQHFRASAMSQVSLQRASIVVIVLILICIEVFLYFTFPEAVVGSLKHPKGYVIWQFALLCIFVGIYWSRRVTDIRL